MDAYDFKIFNHPLISNKTLEFYNILRHIPPDTNWINNASQEEQRIFNIILTLPNDLNPLIWLQQEQGDWLVTVCLQKLYKYILSLWRRSNLDISLLEFHLNSESSENPLVNIKTLKNYIQDITRVFSEENFLRTFKYIQKIKHVLNHPDLTLQNIEIRLFIEILNLPEEENPLMWLRSQRLFLISIIGLEYLISQVLPIQNIGQTTKIWRLNEEMSKYPLKIKFGEITQGQFGVLLITLFEISLEGLEKPFDLKDVIATWKGFTRVYDNFGYRYLIMPGKITTGCDLKFCSGEVHQFLFPMLYPKANILTFVSDPPLVNVNSYLRSIDKSDHMHFLKLNEFQLSIKIPT